MMMMPVAWRCRPSLLPVHPLHSFIVRYEQVERVFTGCLPVRRNIVAFRTVWVRDLFDTRTCSYDFSSTFGAVTIIAVSPQTAFMINSPLSNPSPFLLSLTASVSL
jgi:hypothetical protein